MDVVRGGRPVAVVVVERAEKPGGSSAERSGDRPAAEVLVDWVQKMTGAELPVVESAAEGVPAIFVGTAAVEAGLRLEEIESASREGLRIRSDGRRVLLAGQNETATLKAVCRLLEHWGCRYFVDHPLGQVYPQHRGCRWLQHHDL